MQSFLDWSLRVGRISRIEIRIHWLFIFFMLAELLRSRFSTSVIAYMAVLLVTVLLHELGHCFMGRRYGLFVDRVMLWPLGGMAYVAPGRNASQDFWVAAAGPLVHIPIALIAIAALMAQGGHLQVIGGIVPTLDVVGAPLHSVNWLLGIILTVQQYLFMLNVLLPAFPMDGGRMLVALLQPRLGTRTTARVVTWTTGISAAVLMLLGMPLFGGCLAFSAYQLWMLRQSGEIYHYPGFNHAAPVTRSAPGKKPRRQVPYLRPVGRTCPQCKRNLPDSARMCGFCEIEL